MKWVVRWGAVTVIAVVVAGGYAFGVFDESAPGRGCRGSGDRVRGLEAAVTALGLPAGAAPDVPEQAGNGGGAGRSGPVTESGCFDDHSGIPWVYGRRRLQRPRPARADPRALPRRGRRHAAGATNPPPTNRTAASASPAPSTATPAC